jgi:UDP-N-acetylglucosamine--N-acetylmuramyl-(pentapeptide) pyrophosphoryl-undecaprenol N-acetylglucosamine transferase
LQTVYVTGGSAGSHFINELIFSNLKTLLKNFYLVHQTGNSKFKDYEKGLNQKKLLPKKLGNRYKVKDLFTPKNSAMEMKKADFVIGRSGINTVSELIYFEKPAILIPLPFGQKNEQLTNANFLKDLGLAEVLEQEYLSNEKFIKTIKKMKNNLTNYKLKKQVLTENAVEKIIKILKDVSNKKKT